MAGVKNTPDVSILPFPFEVLVEHLTKVPGVDMISTGDSPATFRWLNGRNVYVNLGMERLPGNETEIAVNNNSYAVTGQDILEASEAITKYMKDIKWEAPTPQVPQKTYKETKASDLAPTP